MTVDANKENTDEEKTDIDKMDITKQQGEEEIDGRSDIKQTSIWRHIENETTSCNKVCLKCTF